MKSIYFRSDKELIYFCEIMFNLYHEINVQWKKNKYWGNELFFKKDNPTLEQVINGFVRIFIFHRLDKMIRKIAEDDYYYTDDAEIERISELTKWVLKEKILAQTIFNGKMTIEAFVFALFEKHLYENEMIHFDALMTFCMKPMRHALLIAVGFGIDEMKREEEHQGFIQGLREYIKQRPAKTTLLYIVEGQPYRFYKENGEQYTELELKRLMKSEPLYMLGLDNDEMNISPVITLMPKKIYLFGHHPAEAKTNTLINLFQERLHFLPLNQFPFSITVK